jgi:hypothetical protein
LQRPGEEQSDPGEDRDAVPQRDRQQAGVEPTDGVDPGG